MAADVISFSKYDSTTFATFPESIAHAETNPLLISSLSDWLQDTMDGAPILIQEPSCTFKELIHFFDDVAVTITLPVSEYYNPMLTAKRLYDNADLWYILLLLNNIFNLESYNKPRIRYIPPNELARISKFVSKANSRIRVISDNDLSTYFLS